MIEIDNEEAKLAEIGEDIQEIKEIQEEPKYITSKDMNSRMEGKRIKLKGMVYSVADIFEEMYADEYKCDECDEFFEQEHNKPLRRCSNCNSISIKKKRELRRDFIEIEVEEMPEEVTTQPAKIMVKVYSPIVYSEQIKKIEPGMVVNIIGKVSKEKFKTRNSSELFHYFITLEEVNTENTGDSNDDITEEDIIKIKEIASNKPLETLAKSVAPNVYDMEDIKKTLVLQMVRGPEGRENLRPRINVLIIGEPGVAKSQLARQVAKRVPRSLEGSADNMSGAGLCASMMKEELTGRWVARAGLLSRCNGSLVVLDEFDKLSKDDVKGLHNVMELGKSTVTKAGTHISLKADCSILACCNPKNGGFLDMEGYESISSQVNIVPALLTRFDTIFMVRDKVDVDKDKQIAKALFGKSVLPTIPINLFRKYVLYAMKINPDVDEELIQTFSDIYTKLRQNGIKSPETKIGPRLLRSLGSLAVAHAKLRLSNKVTLEDIEVAEDLMMSSFASMGFGRSLNALDTASLYTKTSTKKIAIKTQIRQMIKEEVIKCKNESRKADWDNIKPILLQNNFDEKDVVSVFKELKSEGTLIGEDYRLVWI